MLLAKVNLFLFDLIVLLLSVENKRQL